MRRIWGLAALVAGIWWLSVYGKSVPRPLGPEVPARLFSSARADAVLGRVLGPERPHPAGSAEAAAVRGRILKELAAMGVAARTQTGVSCYRSPRWSVLPCGTVTNIIASVLPGMAPAVVLMAHSDSVAAGPGAGDDGSGVAILLETIRALKARRLNNSRPVIALFTDGEEAGMLGAAYYLREPHPDIRAVINVEARGNRGPSYLFQTSADNGRLIDLYARSVQNYATSSIYSEVYKYLPNDTDLTPMLAAGVPGYNFAFIGGFAQYHTPRDRRANIDPQSLQQQGDNVLSLATGLAETDSSPLQAPDMVYLDVLGLWLPRLPVAWTLPLSIAAFLLIAMAGFFAPRERRGVMWHLGATLMPPLLLAACVGTGFALHGLAAWISGQPDPSFVNPLWLRLSLGFGAFAMALLASRGAGAIACWLWFAGLAIACAIWMPGAVPYFLFPSLIAAPLLLVTMGGQRGPALVAAALPALLIWIGFAAGSEALMGLRLHPLFMVTTGFGLLALLPLLARAKPWRCAFALSLFLSLAFAVVAGFQPPFSEKAPQRLNLRYVEEDGKAYWLADPVEWLPESLRAAADFGVWPQHVILDGYLAPAGRAHFPAPGADIQRQGDVISLRLHAPGDGIELRIPKDAGVAGIVLGGATMSIPPREVMINCATPDCGNAQVQLIQTSTRPLHLTLIAQRDGLPPEGAALLKARPVWSVPSQAGDRTQLITTITLR